MIPEAGNKWVNGGRYAKPAVGRVSILRPRNHHIFRDWRHQRLLKMVEEKSGELVESLLRKREDPDPERIFGLSGMCHRRGVCY